MPPDTAPLRRSLAGDDLVIETAIVSTLQHQIDPVAGIGQRVDHVQIGEVGLARVDRRVELGARTSLVAERFWALCVRAGRSVGDDGTEAAAADELYTATVSGKSITAGSWYVSDMTGEFDTRAANFWKEKLSAIEKRVIIEQFRDVIEAYGFETCKKPRVSYARPIRGESLRTYVKNRLFFMNLGRQHPGKK